jgi:ABC-type enterochelin transport system permease subunit
MKKMEDQVHTWFSISTLKKTVRSAIQTTTKSVILAGSLIMGLPALYMTIERAWIMRLTHCQHGCSDRFYRTNRFS